MPRDIELVKQELESSTTSIFITKWILEHTPYVFEDYETEYISWRHEIAEKLRIDARDIIITGSASLGFSLNPNKNFKSFDKKSDIDISIISHHYFDVAWHDLIHLSPAGISPKMKTALEDHRKRLIYWGTVATDKILPLLSFDYYYALYETDFIEEESIEFTFDKVCNELVQVLPEIKKTRWSHLIDFYSLFTVLAEVQDSLPLAQDGREALHEKLLAFGNGITAYQRKSDDDKKSDNTNIVLYASGIRNSSDLNARKNRYSALKSELGF